MSELKGISIPTARRRARRTMWWAVGGAIWCVGLAGIDFSLVSAPIFGVLIFAVGVWDIWTATRQAEVLRNLKLLEDALLKELEKR